MAGAVVAGPALLWPIVLMGANIDGGVLGFLILTIFVSGFFSVRIWKQGIYADDRGVMVRGVFTARRLAWEEIRRFELRNAMPDMITFVDLHDGTSVPARALNAGKGLLPAMRRRAQAQVDELNTLLREHFIP